jgi:hypothetical protein
MTKLSESGTLLNKSKTRKLDYQKKGKSFEIDVYELKETKKEGNITQRSFVRLNNFNMIMTEKTLLNYLYAEGFIDEK